MFSSTLRSLIYGISEGDARASVAEELLAEGGCISVQVLNEFAAVARRKLKMSWEEIEEALGSIRDLCNPSCSADGCDPRECAEAGCEVRLPDLRFVDSCCGYRCRMQDFVFGRYAGRAADRRPCDCESVPARLGEGGEGLGAVGEHGGGGGEEFAGVGMMGFGEQVEGGGELDDAAVLHDGDLVAGLVAGLSDDGEIVRDEEHGEAEGAAQGAEEVEHLGLDGDVECGGGLVGDEQAGTVDDGHGDEDALALAAGELVGVVADAVLGVGEGDLVHGGEDARSLTAARLSEGWWARTASAICSPMRMTGLSAVMGSWKIMAMSRPRRRRMESSGRVMRSVESNKMRAGGSGLRGEKAQDGERGGGFAGAGFAYQAEGSAGGDGEGDLVDYGTGGEGDGEGLDLEDGFRRRLRDRS